MDSDLSHEAIERFEALEARVTALEGTGGASGESFTEESTEVEEGIAEEEA